MNIKTNEILLLNKIRFGEVEEPKTDMSETAPETTNPQNGMNALMFQGLKNLMENPELAQEVGIATEEVPQEDTNSAKEFVTPYATNMLSFKANKASMLKTIATTGIIAAGTLGTTSCKDETNIYIDVSALVKAMNDLKASLKESNALTQDQLAAICLKMDALIAEVQAGNKQASDFYKEMVVYMATTQANQEIIISKLEEQGYDRKEALAYLEQLVKDVQAGRVDAQLAWAEIIKLLGDVKDLLQTAVSDIKIALGKLDVADEDRKAMLAEIDRLYKEVQNGNLTAKGFYEAVFRYMCIDTHQKAIIIAQLTKVLGNQKAAEAKIDQLIKEVQEGRKSAEAAWNEIQGLLGDVKELLQAILNKFETTIAKLDISNDKKDDILAEIRRMYQEVVNGNKSAEDFYKSVWQYMILDSKQKSIIIAQLAQVLGNQKAAEDLINTLIKEVQDGKKTAEEAWNEISSKLDGIQSSLDELNANFVKFMNAYKKDQAEKNKLLAQLLKEERFQSSVLVDLKKVVANMDADLGNIESLIRQFKEEVKNGRIEDYNKYKELLEMIDAREADRDQAILNKIDNFENTYIKTQRIIIDLLKKGNAKLDKLAVILINNKNDGNSAVLQEILEAIKNLQAAVEKGDDAQTQALKDLEAKLDKMSNQLTAIFNKMDFSSLKNYLSRILAKFGDVEAILKDLKGDVKAILNKLANIETAHNQTNTYLAQLESRAITISNQIANIEVLAGKSLTKDELEELWQQHDATSFENYKEFLSQLHAEDMAQANDMIKELKENNRLLGEILAAINGMNKNDPDYNDKLNQIIELLKNWKCDCNCGNNNNDDIHEGILNIINGSGNKAPKRNNAPKSTKATTNLAQKRNNAQKANNTAVNLVRKNNAAQKANNARRK